MSMRVTLDIDEDVLQAANELAATGNVSVGRVISDLVRQGLHAGSVPEPAFRNGFKLLPRAGVPITAELISRLADEEF